MFSHSSFLCFSSPIVRGAQAQTIVVAFSSSEIIRSLPKSNSVYANICIKICSKTIYRGTEVGCLSPLKAYAGRRFVKIAQLGELTVPMLRAVIICAVNHNDLKLTWSCGRTSRIWIRKQNFLAF